MKLARQLRDQLLAARLDRIRQDPAVANDPSAIEALARDADTFPAGTVRVDARMLVAEAWLGSRSTSGG